MPPGVTISSMARLSDPIADAGPEAGSARELLQIAVPLILSSGSISLMHVVDRIFLTWHSPDVLAAALPAGIMNWTLLSLPVGLASM